MTTPRTETSEIRNVNYHWSNWAESSHENDVENHEESDQPPVPHDQPLPRLQVPHRDDQDAIELVSVPGNSLGHERSSSLIKTDQSIAVPDHGSISSVYPNIDQSRHLLSEPISSSAWKENPPIFGRTYNYQPTSKCLDVSTELWTKDLPYSPEFESTVRERRVATVSPEESHKTPYIDENSTRTSNISKVRSPLQEDIPVAESNVNYKKLVAKGLPQETKHKDLWNYFSQYGKIRQVAMRTDPSNYRIRGIAFIWFQDRSSLEAACVQEEQVFRGVKIACRKAEAKGGIIYVDKLPILGVTLVDLHHYFSLFGPVVEVAMRKGQDGDPTDHYLVTFTRAEIADEVARSGSHTINGHQIDVQRWAGQITLQKQTESQGFVMEKGNYLHDMRKRYKKDGVMTDRCEYPLNSIQAPKLFLWVLGSLLSGCMLGWGLQSEVRTLNTLQPTTPSKLSIPCQLSKDPQTGPFKQLTTFQCDPTKRVVDRNTHSFNIQEMIVLNNFVIGVCHGKKEWMNQVACSPNLKMCYLLSDCAVDTTQWYLNLYDVEWISGMDYYNSSSPTIVT